MNDEISSRGRWPGFIIRIARALLLWASLISGIVLASRQVRAKAPEDQSHLQQTPLSGPNLFKLK